MKGFLVAGTASGVGKTTVTLAIIAALRRRGYTCSHSREVRTFSTAAIMPASPAGRHATSTHGCSAPKPTATFFVTPRVTLMPSLLKA
jgi:dethiobiotin synthetase